VEALPARLLGGFFVSLYHDNAALFRRAVPLFILLSQVAAVCTFGMSII